MQHFAPASMRSDPVRAEHETTLHALMRGHADAFYDAGHALAGQRGTRLVARLQVQLEKAGQVTRTAQRLACDLLALLSLEWIDDLEGDEAGFFAQIDPASDLVHVICRLTDLLRDALASIEGSRPHM